MRSGKISRVTLTVVVLTTTLFFSSSVKPQVFSIDDSECVILLHGLARTSNSMDKMEKALQSAGYLTANIDYPSRTMKIQDLAPLAVKQGLDACQSQAASKINFVTHSMGGILVRYYLAKNALPLLGQVVMLAPPNKGSLVTDQYRNDKWYKWLTGPSGQQLGTGYDGIPGLLGVVDFPVGVIAGNVHSPIDNWLAEVIPGEDDGKVSVEHTKLEGMRDFIALPYTHISIMKQDEVIRQTLNFLKYGSFDSPG